jgi:hypothetical protein
MQHYLDLGLLHGRPQSTAVSQNARARSGLLILPALAERSHSGLQGLSEALKRAKVQHRGLECRPEVRPLTGFGPRFGLELNHISF